MTAILSEQQQYIMTWLKRGCWIQGFSDYRDKRTYWRVIGYPPYWAGQNFGILPATVKALERKGLIEFRSDGNLYHMVAP